MVKNDGKMETMVVGKMKMR